LTGACEVTLEVFSGYEFEHETTATPFDEGAVDLGDGWMT